MRGFSRSPSPPPMAFHAPLPVPMPRGSVPMAPRPLPPPRTGITTMTSMIIQNLSDTVSKNDVAVSVCACLIANMYKCQNHTKTVNLMYSFMNFCSRNG